MKNKRSLPSDGKKIVSLLFAGLFLFPVTFEMAPREARPLFTPTPTPTAATIFRVRDAFVVPAFKYVNKRGQLKNVKVTAKDATSITVDNEGVNVKVDILASTHFRRKFWGKSSLAEISIGDSVDVVGRWVKEDKTEIKAVLIRNLSIQKRFGVFFGTVKSLTDTGFVMTTIRRGEETVTLDSAKLINRKGQTITAGDIQIGHRVRVRGLWDSIAFTITEVTQVKDFSLPPFASPSPAH
ncbi:MAG: hypothetical protein NTZ07_02680 [Candidatus Woesebacteria bacterium]|nr:hypothetical protein [Candidatus Woesebacteria bacterium]